MFHLSTDSMVFILFVAVGFLCGVIWDQRSRLKWLEKVVSHLQEHNLKMNVHLGADEILPEAIKYYEIRTGKKLEDQRPN